MVGVDSGSLQSSGLILGRLPFGAVLHSSNEPGELSQWLCHDDSTINIVLELLLLCIIYYYHYYHTHRATLMIKLLPTNNVMTLKYEKIQNNPQLCNGNLDLREVSLEETFQPTAFL